MSSLCADTHQLNSFLLHNILGCYVALASSPFTDEDAKSRSSCVTGLKLHSCEWHLCTELGVRQSIIQEMNVHVKGRTRHWQWVLGRSSLGGSVSGGCSPGQVTRDLGTSLRRWPFRMTGPRDWREKTKCEHSFRTLATCTDAPAPLSGYTSPPNDLCSQRGHLDATSQPGKLSPGKVKTLAQVPQLSGGAGWHAARAGGGSPGRREGGLAVGSPLLPASG